MTDFHEMTEAQLREASAPKLKTTEELAAFLDMLATRDHDYGTAVYAMSIAATAAFNFMASKLGVTGFQAGCADMDVIRRTRRFTGPFMLIDGENALFPQYDIPGRVREFLTEIDAFHAYDETNLLTEAIEPPSGFRVIEGGKGA